MREGAAVKRRCWRLTVYVALALLLGCGGGGSGAAPGGSGGSSAATTSNAGGPTSAASSGPPAAGGSSAVAPTTPPAPARIEFGMPVATVGLLDLFVAEQRGLFREQGLTVEVVTTGPASQTVQAIVSSSVQIGSAASDSAIIAVEQGADLVFVAGALNRVTYTLIGAKDVRSYADLRGKNIAVSDLRDGSTTLLRRLLLHAGLREDEVNLVPLGGTPNRAAAVTVGQAAAAVMSQPTDFRLMGEGYPRLGLSTEAVPNYFFQGHSVRRAWLRDNGELMVRFLRAVVAADRYLNDPAHRDDVIAILAEQTRSGQSESAQTYDLVIAQEHGFSREGEVDLDGLRTVINILGESGILTPPLPPAERYYDLSYVERAQR